MTRPNVTRLPASAPADTERAPAGPALSSGPLAAPSAPPRRRGRRILVLLLVLAGLAAAAWGGWRAWERWGGGGEATLRWATTPAVRGDIVRTVTSLGSLQPKDYVDVGAQVSGQVRKVYVEIGDQVTKGQLLAEIDPTIYEAKVRADEARLGDLQAQLVQTRAEMDLARTQARRNQELFEETFVSQDTLDSAQTSARVAEAKVQAIQAQIKQYRSSLEEDKANLGYCRIYAPMGGTVSDQTTLEGQTVNANQNAPVILTIADLRTMTAEAEVSEADVVKIRPGMRAWFTILGLPDRKWEGVVRQIKPTPETVNDVVLYHVLVDVPNDDGVLMTDMTTQCFFVVNEAKDAVLAPLAAVTDHGDGAGELRVLGAGGPETRQVKLGISSRTQIVVTSGLEAGEAVITGQEKAPAPDAGGSQNGSAAKGEKGMPPMPGGGARL
ncbi:MAG: macrolide transporter subunit MacA [Desulfovibrionaceae bacterium]